MCEASETCGGRPLPMEAAVGRVLDAKFLVPAAPTFCEGRDRFGEPVGGSPGRLPAVKCPGTNAARLAPNVPKVLRTDPRIQRRGSPTLRSLANQSSATFFRR